MKRTSMEMENEYRDSTSQKIQSWYFSGKQQIKGPAVNKLTAIPD